MSGDVLIRCLAVAAGGAVGSVARYALSLWGASLETRLPWGTLAANALGCLAMGVAMFFLTRHDTKFEGVRLFIAVGMLGGLTTFSTFSYEGFALLRQGHTGPAGLYIVGSVLVGLGAAAVGWWGAAMIAARV